MARMTVAHLGVIVFVVCLSTQVVAQNSTESPMGNQTATGMSMNATTMATDTYSSAANSTTAPTGAAAHLQSGMFSLLLPVVMVTSLLHRCC